MKHDMRTQKTAVERSQSELIQARLAWHDAELAKLRHWHNLALHLTARGKEICADNHCTDDEHHCESYAYIRHDGALLDICASDYFQGTSKPHAAIPMPWQGTGSELHEAVAADCEMMECESDDESEVSK